jgi:hypothetical protein
MFDKTTCNKTITSVTYKEVEQPFDEVYIEDIATFCKSLFGYFYPDDFIFRMQNNYPILGVFASDIQKNIIGMKVGYAYNDRIFFSWLGGTSELHRRKGIGSELMKRQHAWCITKGFEIIETHTTVYRDEMISLNVKNGFIEIGDFINKRSERVIVFQKKL